MAGKPNSPGGGSAISGLSVQNNETIRAFLLAALDDEQLLPGELRDLASDLSSQSSIPYRHLRSVWFALPVGARPSITAIFSGAEFLFSTPKPREKSEELKERLRKLADMMERKEYDELVKDVAPRKEVAEPFSSYKDQIGFACRCSSVFGSLKHCRWYPTFFFSACRCTSVSCPLACRWYSAIPSASRCSLAIPSTCRLQAVFGLHVVVVMFTGYLFGFAAFRALFNHSAAMNAAGGILGMVGGMLLETVLFILRASGNEMLSSGSSLKHKKQQ